MLKTQWEKTKEVKAEMKERRIKVQIMGCEFFYMTRMDQLFISLITLHNNIYLINLDQRNILFQQVLSV